MKAVSKAREDKEINFKMKLKVGDTVVLKTREQIEYSRSSSCWKPVFYIPECAEEGGRKLVVTFIEDCCFRIDSKTNGRLCFPYQMIEKVVRKTQKNDISKLTKGSRVKIKSRKQISDSGTKRNYWDAIGYVTDLLKFAETVVEINKITDTYFTFFEKKGKTQEISWVLPIQMIEKVISYKKK